MTKEETQPSPIHRYAVAIIIPEPQARQLQDLQKYHYLPPWEPKIDLHITLVSPFSTSETAKALSARLASVAGNTKPFTINIQGFGRFDNAESIFYAKVTPHAKLTALADNALKALIDLHGPRSHPHFTPHITLAAPASHTTVDQYFTKSISDVPALSFPCKQFSLLLLDEKSRQWDIVNNFNFAS